MRDITTWAAIKALFKNAFKNVSKQRLKWAGVVGLIVVAVGGAVLAQTLAGQATYMETLPDRVRIGHDNDLDTTSGYQEIVNYQRAEVNYLQDVDFKGGASAVEFTDSASSIVLPDNDTTALDIGSTGALNLLRFDTGNSAETVSVNGTTNTTAFHVDVGDALFDESAELAVPVMALDKIRFCGNGPNATTTTYVGPVRVEDYEGAGDAPAEDDLAFGGIGCDGQDSTTEATADFPLDIGPFAYYPVGMVCVTDCGTDDTMTFQLRDDAADQDADMTCNVTLTGSAAQCITLDSTPTQVAASSAISISVVNDTDDDCSSGDVECLVYITF